jgi:hypothetical protein
MYKKAAYDPSEKSNHSWSHEKIIINDGKFSPTNFHLKKISEMLRKFT